MPFGPNKEYATFEACEKAHSDKRNPAAYCGEIKKRTEKTDLDPQILVKQINDLKKKDPMLSMRDILKQVFAFSTRKDFSETSYPIQFILLREDSIGELKTWIKAEGLSDDPEEIEEIAFKILKSRKKGSESSESKDKKEKWKKSWKTVGKEFEERRKARELKKQEEEEKAKEHEKKQHLIKEIGKVQKQKVLAKAKKLEHEDIIEDGLTEIIKKRLGALLNKKTGQIIQGEEYYPTPEELESFVPVDSSNVMSSTILSNNLVMNFLNEPNKAYKFQFSNQVEATKAFQSFINAPSKGKWVWQFLRGHVKGEKVTPEKIGPSLERHVPTIGGGPTSLKPYGISSTNLVELQLKSSVNHERLQNLKSSLPKLQKQIQKARKKGIYTSSERELLKARGVRELQYGLKTRDLISLKESRVNDEIYLEDFKFISHDSQHHDFSILQGPITRAGAFPYTLGGEHVILYKQWDNLKDVFSKTSYIPLIGSKEQGAHASQDILGFAYNFSFKEDTMQVLADIITLEDIHLLTDNFIPIEGWEVSIGFKDRRLGNKQIIEDVDHLAMSLLNKEKGRCGLMGERCYLEIKNDFTPFIIHDQNQIEVIS